VNESSYLDLLRKVILNGYSESEVILLEIEPEKQNTKIDFYYCRRDLGIPSVCVTDIFKEESAYSKGMRSVKKFTSSEFITVSFLMRWHAQRPSTSV
jgi:hypothetical protein